MNPGAIITYQPVSSLHWHGSTKILHGQWKQGQKYQLESNVDTFFTFLGLYLLVVYMPKGTTIIAARYINTLIKLHINIKKHWKGRLSAGIILLHNMRPHTAGLTQLCWRHKFKVLALLVYRTILSLCDYEVLGSLKKFLNGKCFSIDKEVKKSVEEWMLEIGADFWRDIMYELPECWQKCINRDGDCV